jgi:hypothetical protein
MMFTAIVTSSAGGPSIQLVTEFHGWYSELLTDHKAWTPTHRHTMGGAVLGHFRQRPPTFDCVISLWACVRQHF